MIELSIRPLNNTYTGGAGLALEDFIQRCDFDIPEDSMVVNERYIVTRNGDVYRYSANHKKIEFQKKRVHTNGYLRAQIDRHDVYLHRLVAMCFLPKIEGRDEVNHIDGNKKNNRAENLEWCNRSENNLHAFRTGLRSYDELSRMAQMPKLKLRKYTPESIRDMRERRSNGESFNSIAKRYGCGHANVQQICSGRTYKDVI